MIVVVCVACHVLWFVVYGCLLFVVVACPLLSFEARCGCLLFGCLLFPVGIDCRWLLSVCRCCCLLLCVDSVFFGVW